MIKTTTALVVITAFLTIAPVTAIARPNHRSHPASRPPIAERRNPPREASRRNAPVFIPVPVPAPRRTSTYRRSSRVQSYDPETGDTIIVDRTGAAVAVSRSTVIYDDYYYDKRKPRLYLGLGFGTSYAGDFVGVGISSNGSIQIGASFFRVFR